MRAFACAAVLSTGLMLAACSTAPISSVEATKPSPPFAPVPTEFKTLLLCQRYQTALKECELSLRFEIDPLGFKTKFNACLGDYHFRVKPPACASGRDEVS
jgi:hypothetical protein